jgi:glycosyltransferase involved in cell wall biosynthesis
MLIRRIFRGKKRPGGVGMISIQLRKGLDRLGVPYRFNDYSYIKKHPEEVACIIGMPFLLFTKKWQNPVILGAAIYSNAIECPDLFSRYPNVRRVLVPGEWMRQMFEPYYHEKVLAWPVGIDTDKWSPAIKGAPEVDFLIYDKIRWKHEQYEQELIEPICETLKRHSLSFEFIRYGSYQHEDLLAGLKKCKSVIFLCEHETQGFAYQQILATGTPVLAWERGGYWQDPAYFPHRVKFEPVSSVPYWDDRCGLKFTDAGDFEETMKRFLAQQGSFKPADYISENLTLEKCAQLYLDIYNQVAREL